MGLFQSLKSGVMELAGEIAHDVGEEATYQVGRGASELAAALFSGSAFVQYGHQASHGQEAPEPTLEQQHDGMEM